MAISVDELFSEFGIKYEGPFKWQQKLNANYNGVYIIALTDNPKSKKSNKIEFNICPQTFKFWLKQAKDLQIEGKKVQRISQVKNYLAQFWKVNENILYIGESSSKTNPLQKRINQFYIHKVGQKGPHTGGYWLKLLSCLKDVTIYYASVPNPREIEFKLLMKFVEKSSGKSFYELENFSNYFPFANLKVDVLKMHEIENYVNNKTRSNVSRPKSFKELKG